MLLLLLLFLIGPGIDINIQDYNGNTALHYACLLNNKNIIIHLLNVNAKCGITNNNGQVAANCASTNYIREITRNPALIPNSDRYPKNNKDSNFAITQMSNIFTKKDKLTLEKKNILQIENDVKISNGENESKMVQYVSDSDYDSDDSDYKNKNAKKKKKKSKKLNITDTEKFSRGKFGPVPSKFSGCRVDMFQEETEVENAHSTKEQYKEMQLLEIARKTCQLPSELKEINIKIELLKTSLTSQKVHPPTNFDNTFEWIEIKDFLWLIGQPYNKKKNYNASLVDDQSKSYLNDNSTISLNLNTVSMVSFNMPFIEKDKRECLYNIAKVMDIAHRIFVNVNLVVSFFYLFFIIIIYYHFLLYFLLYLFLLYRHLAIY
jgi:hypothetical protein